MSSHRSPRFLRPTAVAYAVSVLCLGGFATTSARAQDKIEEVLISAQKRTERLQDVPAAVKAFTPAQIENAGIKTTSDFVNLTPNMSFDQSFTYNNSFVTLRGVTQINNADSPVAVVIDGVPQGNQKQMRMELYDIERIEVLKGPQGALYGRNAIGGAINIETKQPKGKTEGFASAGFGNASTRQVNAGLGGALKEDVAFFRLSLADKTSDGMIGNTYLKQNVDAIDKDRNIRAKLLLLPSSEVSVDLRVSTNEVKAGATTDSIVMGNPSVIAYPKSNMLGKTEGSTDDFSAKIEVETDHGKLTSITSQTKLKESYRGDIDFTDAKDNSRFLKAALETAPPLGFGLPVNTVGLGQGQNLAVDLWSQELRWTSPAKQPVRYIAGVYYLDTKRKLDTRAYLDITGQLSQYDTSSALINRSESNHNTAPAYFGQFDVDLNPQVTASGGLRYDSDRRENTDLKSGKVQSATFSKWQPKFNLSYKADQNQQYYATASTGFRSGGFNGPGIARTQFKSETLTNYEVGSKTIGADGRWFLNAALFQSKSTDFQYFQVDAATASQIILNIDSVKLSGFDIDGRWLLSKSWELDAGIGYTATNIEKFAEHPEWVGRKTPKNVPLKTNLGLQYSAPVQPGLRVLARADYEQRSKKYWHPDNTDVSPSLGLLNLRLALAEHKDAWSVSLTGRNVGDKKYYADFNSAAFSGLPYNIGSLASGRTVLVEGKIRF